MLLPARRLRDAATVAARSKAGGNRTGLAV